MREGGREGGKEGGREGQARERRRNAETQGSNGGKKLQDRRPTNAYE